MNKEEIQKRLKDLEQQVANVEATLHAIQGARQELRFWLKVLEERESGSLVEAKENS